MKNLFEQCINWYKGLAWYWKLIGWIIFLVFMVGALLIFFYPKASDTLLGILKQNYKLEKKILKENMDKLKGEDEKLTEKIEKKKEEIAKKMEESAIVESESVSRREEIKNATTMEELDKLQEKYGL